MQTCLGIPICKHAEFFGIRGVRDTWLLARIVELWKRHNTKKYGPAGTVLQSKKHWARARATFPCWDSFLSGQIKWWRVSGEIWMCLRLCAYFHSAPQELKIFTSLCLIFDKSENENLSRFYFYYYSIFTINNICRLVRSLHHNYPWGFVSNTEFVK